MADTKKTSSEHKDIHAAINAVMGEVGYVQKTKTNGLNYSFASEADLIKALRPVMIEHGITFYPSGVQIVANEAYETSNGKLMNRVIGMFTFTFTHAPSGTSLQVTVLGEGADVGDKASNKAMTGALKYALRQTFVIETGDDPDATSSEEQDRKSKPGSNGKASQPVPHWTEWGEASKRFWEFAETLKLDDEEVYKALAIQNLSDFKGSMNEAKQRLEAYAGQREPA
jgi:hypothetical protein